MQKRKGDELRAHLLFGCAAADLVQGNPQSLIVPFRLHQVSGAFHRCAPLLWAFPPNYQTKANKYTIIPAINEINSVILTKNFAGTSLLLHIYCISSEASIPTIQDRINTIIPDLFVAYAIAKEHNAITTAEVIILFFFIYATSIAFNMTLLLFIVKHFEIRRCSLRYRILYSWIYCKRSHTFRTSKENLKLLLFFTNTI